MYINNIFRFEVKKTHVVETILKSLCTQRDPRVM